MLLVLAVIVAFVTLAITVLIIMADSMSDAPCSMDNISIVPVLIIGSVLCAILIGFWYFGGSIHWVR